MGFGPEGEINDADGYLPAEQTLVAQASSLCSRTGKMPVPPRTF
jgi:hypothetical protein